MASPGGGLPHSAAAKPRPAQSRGPLTCQTFPGLLILPRSSLSFH